MKKKLKQLLVMLIVVGMLLPMFRFEANAMSYSGSSSYKSGKYYKQLTNVSLTGDQRKDIVNIARSQVGYQEGSSSSQLAGTTYGGKNYTEYGRWYGLQDMWCAMFVSWCADVAGVSTSVVPKHCFTPTGLQWFKDRGRAYSRSTVAKGNYTPKAGDIIYFKSSRNSNSTNHVGIVTKYSNGTVYTIEGNTSSATISTNGGAVCEKSYSISNTYIVYICSPAYKTTSTSSSSSSSNTSSSSSSWLSGAAKDMVFDSAYYAARYPDLRAAFGTDANKLFDHFLNYGIKEGRIASAIFSIQYYVENNSDLKAAFGTDYVAAMKHFASTGINEARVTAPPVNLGASFQARIGFPSAGLNFSLSDTNVITYTPSDKPAQVWTFERHPSGAYRIINTKNGYSLATEAYNSESNVVIAEYKDSRKQLWYIYEKGDGRYMFRSMGSSGCVIDVYGGLTEPLTNVWLYNSNGSAAQQFSIDKLSGLNSMTPVNLGTDFYAKINASEGMNLSLSDTNVVIYSDSSADAQLWKFVRQADGSYKIINKKNGKLLDVYWATGTSNANVQVYDDTDSTAHKWFIYELNGQYVFRPACSNTCVLDVACNGTADMTNVQTYVFNGEDSQLFDIVEVKETLVPVDLGADFYAKITATSGKNLSLSGENVIIYGASSAPAQVWRFARNTDGSYRIINQKTGYCLDVYGASGAAKTNVQIYQGNDSAAQKWFIYKVGDKYKLRPACSDTCVLDVEGNGSADMTNVQIYTSNESDAQKFSINVVEKYFDAVSPADVGTNFYAKLSSELGKNLSLSGDDVILYPASDKPAQKWLFKRQADGSYEIVNSKNDKLLTVNGNIGNSGTNVVISADIDGLGQRWFIYLKEGKYVFRPATTSRNVLNVRGGNSADLTPIEINRLDNSSAQKFSIVLSESASETASTNMVVLRKIMYAVETGGQVYGKCDYADFTEAYTNTSEEHAITIGAGQWYGPEAKTLLNNIRKADPVTFSKLDTAGVAADLDNKNWSEYRISKTSAKAKCIVAIISSDIGKKCQDELMDSQLSKYMKEAADLGVTDEAAQMMCANIRHLGGLSAVKRVLKKTETPYTMHTIYQAMQSDTGNQVGTFRSRHLMVYESLKKYIQ